MKHVCDVQMCAATQTLVMLKLEFSEEIKASFYQNCKIPTTLYNRLTASKDWKIKLQQMLNSKSPKFSKKNTIYTTPPE